MDYNLVYHECSLTLLGSNESVLVTALDLGIHTLYVNIDELHNVVTRS